MTESGTRASLIEGDVKAHLIKLTVPMIWGILAMHSLNLADTWFVAQLGKKELAAMSFTFPVVMVILSLGIGFMAGTSSVLARVIGGGDLDRVRRITTDSLYLAIAVSLVCTVLGLMFMDDVFRLLGATEDLLPLIRDYMVIWFCGLVFFLLPMAGVGCLRATGDAKLQSQVLIAAALVNLVLDPLLIFGLVGFPKMGISGAALATVIARGTSLVIGFVALRNRDMLQYQFCGFRSLLRSWFDVAHVGLPAVGTNVIIPLGTGVVVAMIARYGPDAVAGHGAAARVESLVMVVFLAMSSMIGPFVGQNLGADKPQRIQTAMQISGRFCLVFGLALMIVIILGAEFLVGLFSDDENVQEFGKLYLYTVSAGFGAAGLVMVVNAAFNGLGKPLPAVMVSTSRIFVLMVPLAWLGSLWLGPAGIFSGILVANIGAATLGYIWFRRLCTVGTVQRSAIRG